MEHFLCDPAIVPSLFIPAAATGPGLGESEWSTDVVVNNPGQNTLTYEVRFLAEGADKSGQLADATFSLEPNVSVAYPDAVRDLIGIAHGSGALRFDVLDGGYLLVTSRTKNTDGDGATFGQGIPSIHAEDLIVSHEKVRLLQLSEDEHYRTNIGFMNASQTPITIHVDFFSATGVLLGQDWLDLLPYSFEQWDRAFDRIEAGKVQNGYVDVWTETEGAAFYTYGSVVDEMRNDPTYIEPQRTVRQ